MLQLKLCYSDQIRRTRTAAHSLAFDSVVRTSKKLFAALPQNGVIEFLWMDEDGDIIVASSDEEFAEAVRVMGSDSTQCLRFEIRCLPNYAPVILDPPGVKEVTSAVHNGMKTTCSGARRRDASPIIERRNRSGRGSCRGPYYRSHSRIRCPNRLEQPHPKSLSWLTYLRGMNADSLFPPISASQQDETYYPTLKTHLPFSPFFHNEAHSAPLQLAFVNTTSDLALNLKYPIEENRSSQCPLPADIESLSLTLTPAAPLAKPMVCFIRDVTFPDSTAVQPRSTFFKTWRVRNVGTTQWPDGLTLSSEANGAAKLEPRVAVAQIEPGQDNDVTIQLTAPDTVGRHTVHFSLLCPSSGAFIGPPLKVDITVVDEVDGWHVVRAVLDKPLDPKTQLGYEWTPVLRKTCPTFISPVPAGMGPFSTNSPSSS